MLEQEVKQSLSETDIELFNKRLAQAQAAESQIQRPVPKTESWTAIIRIHIGVKRPPIKNK